jgi:HD-GYP domain-containing protein (c-di-GMP phosphodiesterase class II)
MLAFRPRADGPGDPTPTPGRTAGRAGVRPSEAVAGRVSEALAALSVVLDAAERRPPGFAVRSAYLAGRIAGELGLPEERRADLVIAGLLIDIGATGPISDGASVDASRHGRSGRGRSAALPVHLTRGARATAAVATLGLPDSIARTVIEGGERWDGRGPSAIRRDRLSQDGRILALAALIAALGPAPPSADVDRAVRAERGRTLDPGLTDIVLGLGRRGLWTELADTSLSSALLALEPTDHVRWLHDDRLDAIGVTFADIVDTRTPRMGRHGRRVAGFAVRTGRDIGLDPALLVDLRWSALFHDVGKLLVPIAYLEKPGQLTDAERRVIDEHARTSAAVLGRSRALTRLAPLVVAHHERLDGNGMFPTLDDEPVAMAARVLALSDRYEAMTAERPYRSLLSPAQVWSILDEVVGEPMARIALRALRRAVVEAP